MIPQSWFVEAQNWINPFIKISPVTQDVNLGVVIKWENHQVAGIGLVTKENYPGKKIIGVQSTASSNYHNFYYRNTLADVVEILSLPDGLEGRVEDASITIPMVKQVVNEIVLVSEAEISEAVRWSWKNYGEVIEGSAAVTLAARLNGKINPLPVVIIISGGNIVGDLHKKIVEETR
jgi:threonine dehydratase